MMRFLARAPIFSIVCLGVCFLLASPGAAAAQETSRVLGTVVDAETGMVLSAATIRVDNGERILAMLGTFILRLPPGEHRIVVELDGYIDSEIVLTVTAEDQDLDVELSRIAVLASVEVVATSSRATPAGAAVLEPDDVFNVAGGLDNVFRSLQLLPGVAAPEDFGGRLSVRGGGPDQNLTIMDGVEIHNPYRLFGVVSAFNPEVIDRFELTAGGFSARYGDRLSSLLVVDSRRGRPSFGGAATVSVTDANVVLEGDLPGRNGNSWLLTGRRTYYDLVASRITDSDFPSFADIQGRVDIGVGSGVLSLSGLRSREGADINIDDEEEGNQARALQDANNDLVSVRYVAPLGRSGTSQTVASWYENQDFLDFDGSFRNEARRSNTPDVGSFDSSDVIFRREVYVRDWALRQDFTLPVGRTHLVNTGFEIHSLTTGTRFISEGDRNEQEANGSSIRGGAGLPDEIDSQLNGVRAGIWIEDALLLSDRFTLTPGIRFDYSGANERGTVSPRLAAEYLIDTRTRLRAAGGLYTQSPGYEKLLQADYFIDLSNAADKGIVHQQAWHALVGAQRELAGGFSLTVEGYYKTYADLILGRLETEAEQQARVDRYDFPEELQGSVPTAPIITSNPSNGGRGRSYGLDLFLLKRPTGTRGLYGWLSYTLGKSDQDAYGRTFAFDYDRRHALNLVANYRFGDKWEFGMTGRWASGFARTAPLGLRVAATEDPDHDPASGSLPSLIPATDLDGNLIYAVDYGDVSNLNSGRLPYYGRIDARLTFRPGGAASRWEVFVEVLNALNRDNAGELEPSLVYNPDGPLPTLVETPSQSLPLVPSFGVRFRF
jgi:hypothetical protein